MTVAVKALLPAEGISGGLAVGEVTSNLDIGPVQTTLIVTGCVSNKGDVLDVGSTFLLEI